MNEHLSFVLLFLSAILNGYVSTMAVQSEVGLAETEPATLGMIGETEGRAIVSNIVIPFNDEISTDPSLTLADLEGARLEPRVLGFSRLRRLLSRKSKTPKPAKPRKVKKLKSQKSSDDWRARAAIYDHKDFNAIAPHHTGPGIDLWPE